MPRRVSGTAQKLVGGAIFAFQPAHVLILPVHNLVGVDCQPPRRTLVLGDAIDHVLIAARRIRHGTFRFALPSTEHFAGVWCLRSLSATRQTCNSDDQNNQKCSHPRPTITCHEGMFGLVTASGAELHRICSRVAAVYGRKTWDNAHCPGRDPDVHYTPCRPKLPRLPTFRLSSPVLSPAFSVPCSSWSVCSSSLDGFTAFPS